MQGIPPADVVSTFQAGLEYCEKCLLSSSVLKCFDDELNEIPSVTTLTFAANDASSDRTSSHCPAGEEAQFMSCSECKPSNHVNTECQANLCSADCYDSEADNCCEFTQETSCVALSTAEPQINFADDDVSWFFEDTSDTGIDCVQQTIDGMSRYQHLTKKVMDGDLEGKDNVCSSLLPMKMLPADLNGYVMPALNCLHLHGKDEVCDGLENCLSESLSVNVDQVLSSDRSDLNTNDCALMGNSLERCTQGIGNAVQQMPTSQKSLPSHRMPESEFTDDILASKSSQINQFTIKPLIPLLNEDDGIIQKQLTGDRLRTSRVLRHSRHFRLVKNTVNSSAAANEDDLSTNISAVCGCDFESSLLLTQHLNHTKMFTNKEFSEAVRQSVHQRTIDSAVNGAFENNVDREPGYFDRLETIGLRLSHGEDELMRLAIEICHRQLALDPTQTWFVFIAICLP